MHNTSIEGGMKMNVEKIGKFISTCRKDKQLTQKQLAEKLGLSINAVSKWERGLSLPDVSLMQELCAALDITLNELFAGEKLNTQEMIMKSEKNMMNLIMAKDQLETFQIFTEILILVGFIITGTLRFTLAQTEPQKLIVLLLGSIVVVFGIYLRAKIKKALNQLNESL